MAAPLSARQVDLPNWELREHGNGELYWVYVPDNYDPQGSYPIVLAMHGCCWDGVVPTEQPTNPIATAFHGFFHNVQSEPTFIMSPMSTSGWISKGNKLIEILDELMEEFPIDQQRQILSGFSMGAAGVRDFISTYRDRFAAGIMVAATFNDATTFALSPLVDIPVWVAVGTSDGGYFNSRTAVSRWRAAAGFDIGFVIEPMGIYPRFSTFNRVGHGPAMEATFNGELPVVEWALAQRMDGNLAPWVRFSSPAYETVLGESAGDLLITGTAGDRDGSISMLELWVNDVPVLSQTEGDFSYTWLATGQTPGTHRFRVRVTDNAPRPKTMQDELQLHVAEPKSVADPGMPPAYVGRFYRQPLPVEGTTGPVSFRLLRNNNPPPGMRLRSNGILEGYPSTTGTFAFAAYVSDLATPMIQQTYAVEVRAAPSMQAIVTDLSVTGQPAVVYGLGLWDVGEPYAMSGYGLPAGAYATAPDPLFDGIPDAIGIQNAQILRMSGMDNHSTAAEVIRFRVSGRARVWIGYNLGVPRTVPSWIADRGFSDAGITVPFYLAELAFFHREFANELVSLGGNAGNVHGGRQHYLVVVESLDGEEPFNLPDPVSVVDYQIQRPANTWMGLIDAATDWLPWFYHHGNGWPYALNAGPDQSGGWYYSAGDGDWIWTTPAAYPHYFSARNGWLRR